MLDAYSRKKNLGATLKLDEPIKVLACQVHCKSQHREQPINDAPSDSKNEAHAWASPAFSCLQNDRIDTSCLSPRKTNCQRHHEQLRACDLLHRTRTAHSAYQTSWLCRRFEELTWTKKEERAAIKVGCMVDSLRPVRAGSSAEFSGMRN